MSAATTGTVISSVRDVTAFVDSRPRLKGAARAAWIVALGGLFLDAFANSALGSALAPLTKQLDLTPQQVGILTASSAVVALIVNPFGGWLADRIGRLKPLILTKFIYILGALLTVMAPSFEMVLSGRIMVGIAYGIDFSIAMALLAEYTPAKDKSKLNLWNGIWYIAVVFNLLVTLAFTSFGVGQDIWRYSVGSSGVLAVIVLILQLRLLAESPTWLARLGRLEEATASLRKLFPTQLFQVGTRSSDPRDYATGKGGNLWLIFRGKYRRRTVLAGIISLCQYMQYSAVGWYLPVIALALFDNNFVYATLAAIAFNLFGILGGFSSPWLGKRIGLRNAAMFGFAAVFLVMFFMGYLDGKASPYVLAIFPALLILFHSVGPASNGKSIAALSYRSEIRATGTAFTGFLANVGAAFGLFAFPVLRGAFPLGVVLIILSVVPLIGFITCWLINWDPSKNGFAPDEEADAPGMTALKQPTSVPAL